MHFYHSNVTNTSFFSPSKDSSLRTDDISPPRRQIISPDKFGERYEHLKPKRIGKEPPNKIMNFCLITDDIDGASPKKISLVKTRDLLATEDIDGAKPDPYRTREKTKRFNLKIKRMSKRRGNKSAIIGKYSNPSQSTNEDYSTRFAYANHINYVQPKDTKFLAKSRRYYQNKNNFNSNIDFQWKDEFDEGESDEEEEEYKIENDLMKHNQEYEHLNNDNSYFERSIDQNTPLKRQESQDKELDLLMKDNYKSQSQKQIQEYKENGGYNSAKEVPKLNNIRIR